MVADFQQFYGVDLLALVDAGEWERARVLASQLPRESRVLRAIEPSLAWGDVERLLASICDNLAFMRYERAVASGARVNGRPRPVRRPGDGGRPVRVQATVHGMSRERVGEILARPRA